MLFWFGLGFVTLTQPIDLLIFSGLALTAVIGGLCSSLLHLGHPERAFRALSQWRSSWLSREGVFAVVTVGVACLYAMIWFTDGQRSASIGMLLSAFSMITVWATAMIYGSLKTIARWYHPLTPWVYVSLSICGGLVAVVAWEQMMSGSPVLVELTTGVLVLAFVVKVIWWRRAGQSGSGSTPESATGLGAMGQVDLLMSPHTEENWLQHEMGFVVARKHAQRLSQIAVVLAFLLPLLALWSGVSWAILAIPFVHFVGIMIERWLFFAEAKHVVTLFYGDRH